VDVVGDDAVSCKNSGFVERNLGTKTFFCQVLTQSRFPHDREVDNAGNGHRPADILLKEWAGRRDLAVDLTIVHPNPGACRPLRSSAANSLKDKGEQKSGRAPTPAGGWAWTSPPWCSTPGGGPPRVREGGGEDDVRPMQRPAPQRTTGPLGGPSAGVPNDGVITETPAW